MSTRKPKNLDRRIEVLEGQLRPNSYDHLSLDELYILVHEYAEDKIGRKLSDDELDTFMKLAWKHPTSEITEADLHKVIVS